MLAFTAHLFEQIRRFRAAVDDCRLAATLSPIEEDNLQFEQQHLIRDLDLHPDHSSGKATMAMAMSGQEMLEKLAVFNKYYDGKIHHQMRAEQRDDGNVFVEGPLRIYWGLSRPIQLAHCDNIPPAPISQWRHSLHVGPESPVESPNKSFTSMSLRRTGSPARKSRELDDLLSPPASDDVIRRKKGGVRKFKTVAYRGGDQPSKWKRASINGHIFNFDTSVFTPVLGSCTSVTVDGTLNSLEVIETLLDKFKVQNSADEYVLSIVNEEGERLLTNRDRPLLERLKLGPDESVGKIFIKEREVLLEEGVGELVVSANIKAAVTAGDGGNSNYNGDADRGHGITRGHRSSSIKMPIRETEEEENLPHEVEQLLVLPEAVLRGLLDKYRKDEEIEVKKIQARYDVFRQRMTKRLHEILSKSTSSTA
ncbi:ras association domain-containing protein 2 [Plakobranchus ocellatus]|uniref:Ras association domain-containing protein 2 n=1 Tax=Plakobranchus ocellatus TaxID=259542 RepID=A0AAV4BJW1_9GAST|nr:ras association domain-containing protein 2 [Plakobranchus ocellatus]